MLQEEGKQEHYFIAFGVYKSDLTVILEIIWTPYSEIISISLISNKILRFPTFATSKGF